MVLFVAPVEDLLLVSCVSSQEIDGFVYVIELHLNLNFFCVSAVLCTPQSFVITVACRETNTNKLIKIE